MGKHSVHRVTSKKDLTMRDKFKLRPWQQACGQQAVSCLKSSVSNVFLIDAAPGAGKTICALAIIRELIKQGLISRVIYVTPRKPIGRQWIKDARKILARNTLSITGRDQEIEEYGLDVCVTFQAVPGCLDALQAICRSEDTLIVADELHHASGVKSWGIGAEGAFSDAKYILALSGTAIRSDGDAAVWLPLNEQGGISLPAQAIYRLTYGEAVDLEYCRPASFHIHRAEFSVDLQDGESVTVASDCETILPGHLQDIESLRRALDYDKLVREVQYLPDGTVDMNSYQASMLRACIEKLDDLRRRMPDAAGLVIAPSIPVAEAMAEMLHRIEGERPIVVHNEIPNTDGKIDAFRTSDKRWIVSVQMIGEGIDIPRLRVLCYLPRPMTETAFRQALGRVIRNYGPNDDTRAYVAMPEIETFKVHARRVELEMSPSSRNASEPRTTKICRICHAENSIDADACCECDSEFPVPPPRLKPCPACEGLVPMNLENCMHCGASFGHQFHLRLNTAMRAGGIVRGGDFGEEEFQEGEAMADDFRRMALRSGDEWLLKITRIAPDESLGRLFAFTDEIKKARSAKGE